jgi:LysR family cyn operon transcriptional activator
MDEPVEIRQLRYFLAVAETQNFTRAAERLRVTQPSVSQQVARLERQLGAALLRRIGKRVQLTEAGALFRDGAETVLRKLERARESVRDVAHLLTGHVELGVIPALHVAWVPGMLERVSRAHPGVAVGVLERASSTIETELEAGRMDLGFGLVTHQSPGVRYERLVSEPFCMIVQGGRAAAARRAVDLAELDGVRLVLLPASFDMRRAADELLRRARARPRVAYEIGSIDSVLATVARVGTPTLLPAVALRGRESLGLRALPLAGRTRPIDFGLLWPAASARSPAALAVAAALKEALGLAPRRRPPV